MITMAILRRYCRAKKMMLVPCFRGDNIIVIGTDIIDLELLFSGLRNRRISPIFNKISNTISIPSGKVIRPPMVLYDAKIMLEVYMHFSGSRVNPTTRGKAISVINDIKRVLKHHV